VANTSNIISDPSDIQSLLDRSVDLYERAIRWNKQSVVETANLQQLIEQSNLLLAEGQRLCEWELPWRKK
jgi:hypothetical protein